MTDPVFQQAYDTVRTSFTASVWATLTPRQITEAIYVEIRRIDAGLVKSGDAASSQPVARAAG